MQNETKILLETVWSLNDKRNLRKTLSSSEEETHPRRSGLLSRGGRVTILNPSQLYWRPMWDSAPRQQLRNARIFVSLDSFNAIFWCPMDTDTQRNPLSLPCKFSKFVVCTQIIQDEPLLLTPKLKMRWAQCGHRIHLRPFSLRTGNTNTKKVSVCDAKLKGEQGEQCIVVVDGKGGGQALLHPPDAPRDLHVCVVSPHKLELVS